jgi:hypothetical protein
MLEVYTCHVLYSTSDKRFFYTLDVLTPFIKVVANPTDVVIRNI